MRWLTTLLLLSAFAFAGISDYVKVALSQGDFASGEAELQAYRAQQGVTPEYLEGLSWLARGYLVNKQLDRAQATAKQKLPASSPFVPGGSSVRSSLAK